MRPFITAIATLALFAAAPAMAAPPTVAELQTEVRADKKTLREQKRDLRRITRFQRKWERAREAGNTGLEARMDEKFEQFLVHEFAENHSDRLAARREFLRMGGSAEVLAADHEGRAVKILTPKRAVDDRQDMRRLKAHIAQTHELAKEIRGMQPAFDYGTAGGAMYDAKSDLIAALVLSQKRDIRRANAELQEDEAHLARRNRR